MFKAGQIMMKKALSALALSVGSLPPQISMAQSLPEPLKPIGNLSRPFNLIVPNYNEAPSPSSWEGIYLKPTLSYTSASFDHSRFGDAKGMTIGISGGYDLRYNHFIFGPTADLNYDFMRSDDFDVEGISGYDARIHFDGSVGARAGFLWDRTQFYVTGGYAFAKLSVKNDSAGLEDSHVLSGWTAGGGVEYLWSDDVSLRLGYRRLEFSSKSFDSLPAGSSNVGFGTNKFDIGFVRRF
jgi:outer membrane immunogenic protein